MSRELAPRVAAVAWTSAVAALVVAIAVANGGYGLTSRTVVTVTAWGLLIIAVGFGRVRLPDRPARVCCALLAAFAGWTLASAVWAASVERVVIEFNRVALYLGVLLLALVAVPRRRLADGLFLGLVVIAGLALTTRLFPHVIGAHLTPLPSAATRLSYPVGYWNGLGMLVSFALPLGLRGAVVGRSGLSRAGAVAVFPLVACVIYLTSSRGAGLTAAAGVITFLAVTTCRWRALGALLAGLAGSAVVVTALAQRHTLVDGPLGSDLASQQGRSMSLVLLGAMALSAILFAAGDRLLRARRAPSAAVGRALVAIVLILAVVAASASHPVKRFNDFKRPIPTTRSENGAHLLSWNGSGRWQFWGSAVHEFRSAPVIGRGAGSFPAWWSQHASFTYFVQNAHSLYLEVLGELGLVGLLLLLSAFGAGLAGCVAALRSTDGDLRVTIAGGTAVFVAFLVGAALDWIWQLAAVGMVGLAGLAVATRAPARAEQTEYNVWAGVAAIAIAWAVVCAAALPWLTAQRIDDSQAAVRRGDDAAAVRSALDAKSLEPWAASPYLQLALVAERDGQLVDARNWIGFAIHRDQTDWRLWYVAARIEREAGLREQASQSYARARSLNPRSPIFAANPR